MNCFKAAFLVAMGFAAASPAYAGFQFVPGQNATPSPATPSLVDSQGAYTGGVTGDGSSYLPGDVNVEPLTTVPAATPPTPAPIANEEILTPLPSSPDAPAQVVRETPAFSAQPIQTINSETAGTQPQGNAQNTGSSGTLFQWMGQGQTQAQQDWNAGRVDQQFQPQQPAQAPVQMNAPVQQPANYAMVEGFGSDLPLVLALPQIVPPEYSYSFARDVNPGAMVSWNGGKSWDQVLREMVVPLGLSVEITGKTVRFEKAGAHPYAREAMAITPSANNSYAETQRRNIVDPGQGGLVPQAADAYKAMPASAPPENIQVNMRDDNDFNNYAPQPQQVVPAAPAEEEPSWYDTISQKMAKFGDEFRTGNKVQPTQSRMWEAQKGDSLKNTLVEWSKEANVNLVWNSSRDYTVDSNIMVNGTFNNAIKTVFTEGLQGEQKPNLKFVDNPNSDQSTTFIVSDNS